MQQRDQDNPIVVFRVFDEAIQAHIAKSKLDAYGIPCFLTEENMANLYPGVNLNAFKIRLHLFESDVARAADILYPAGLTAEDDGPICPRCHSANVTRAFPRKDAERLKYVLFGVFLPHRKVSVCEVCGYEF